MFRNYLKVAYRNLLRRKFYSAVTLIGLSAGFAFVLFISGYIWSVYQVNAGLRNPGRQYFLQSQWKQPEMGSGITSVAMLSRALAEQYPSLVASYYRFDGLTTTISSGNKHFREVVQPGDSTLLSMFGFPLLYGDPQRALNRPDAVVITEETALKYFGEKDVIGRTLQIDNFSGTRKPFTVTGVMQKLPSNSVSELVQPGSQIFLAPGSLDFFGRNMDSWTNVYIPGYIELQEGVSPAAVDKAIEHLLRVNTDPGIYNNLKVGLSPLRDFYLTANNGAMGKIVFMLSVIALFIIFMAVVNFVNISIGSSSSRLREIGVRKVIGGMRRQLTWQFLTESLLLVLFSLLAALALYVLFRPLFSGLVMKEVPPLTGYPWYFFVTAGVCAAITALLAGIYPALLLSGINPVDSLKGRLRSVKDNALFRKVLVTFQFAIAVFVFTGSIVVTRQVKHFFGKNLGYNKDGLVAIAVPRNWSDEGVQHMETVRDEMGRLAEVSAVTLSYEIPNGNNGGSGMFFRDGLDSSRAVSFAMLAADEKYAGTYQIPLREGSFFSAGASGFNPLKVVINEKAAKVMGWDKPGSAVGRVIRMTGMNEGLIVAGVVKDFHFGPMQQAIQPLIFTHVKWGKAYRYLTLRVSAGNISASLRAIEKKWNELMPGTAFDYSFLDQRLESMYQSELQLEKASYLATFLALVIVLLGVLGMVSLSIVRRTKEIGIRKVLGASVPDVIRLFFKEFSAAVVVANVIALPLAFFAMQRWLNDYAYRIDLQWYIFAAAGTGLILLAGITIAVQTFGVATARPAESLRSE